MIKKEEVYKIGLFNKPHGIHGELQFTFTDDIFDRVDCDYLICLLDGIFVPFFIEEYRFRSDSTALVKLEGIDTAERARMFTNIEVYFPVKHAEEAEDGELSWNFFIGFQMEDIHHGPLGEVIDVDTTTVNTLFVVEREEEELLVPAQEEFIVGIDQKQKLITVELPEGLLNLAKADYLPEQIKLEEIRLDELLLDAREMVMKANPDYTIELIFGEEADDDSVLTVLGNGYLLKTAFVNLMENNCKFSANHTSFVQISFWEQKSVIRFSDTGIGMNADDMQHLFSPFYRGSNKDYARGNGIGMMLTQKIIHTHKGEIAVNSQPSEGTVYTVEIPHI